MQTLTRNPPSLGSAPSPCGCYSIYSWWPLSMVILPFPVLASSSGSDRYTHVALADWDRIIFYTRWLFLWNLTNWSSPSLCPWLLVVSLSSALCIWFYFWLVWTTLSRAPCIVPVQLLLSHLLFSVNWGSNIFIWTTVFWPLQKQWTARLLVGTESNSETEAVSWEQTMDLCFVSGKMGCFGHWLFCSIYLQKAYI